MTGTTTRRTQAERSAATRRVLLNAAADCLVDHGLAGLSIAAVAERAGLSTGAVFHHFADKAELVKAMADHISDHVQARFVASLPTEGDLLTRLKAAIDSTFQSYEDPWLLAGLELLTASRTEHDLGVHLRQLGEREGEEHVATLRSYLSGVADVSVDRAKPLIELAVFSIQGLALTTLRGPNEPMRQRLRTTLGVVTEMFTAVSSANSDVSGATT